MLERSIEQYLRREVIKRNGFCIKMDSEKGLPDRLVLTPNGKHIFVELKRPDGRLSEIQKEYHKRLRARHHAVWVLWNYEDVDKFVNYYFKGV